MLDLEDQSFKDEIQNGLVLVDFYATWCGPCKMMHPVIEEIHNCNQDLKIIKVDVDKHDELAREYGIMSIPTLILFKEGKMVEKNIGYLSKEQLDDWIKNYRK